MVLREITVLGKYYCAVWGQVVSRLNICLLLYLVKRFLIGEKKPRSTTFEVFNGISSDERHYIDSQSLMMILLIFRM
jgi:hypothetical protein